MRNSSWVKLERKPTSPKSIWPDRPRVNRSGGPEAPRSSQRRRSHPGLARVRKPRGAVPKPILCAFKAAECGGSRGEYAQRVQKPLGSSRAEGLSTVEPVQMTGGRSQQTNEEVAMADCVDSLLDDLPRQSRSHRPYVGRLIGESGGRNADALNSLESSRMLHGEFLSVSGCHGQYHRTEWAGSLPPALRGAAPCV